MSTPVKPVMTKAEQIQRDISRLANRYEKSQERYKALVANDDFEDSLRYLPESIKYKYHQRFAKAFKLEDLDLILRRLLGRILNEKVDISTGAGEVVLRTAIEQAEKEQYALCVEIKEFLADSSN